MTSNAVLGQENRGRVYEGTPETEWAAIKIERGEVVRTGHWTVPTYVSYSDPIAGVVGGAFVVIRTPPMTDPEYQKGMQLFVTLKDQSGLDLPRLNILVKNNHRAEAFLCALSKGWVPLEQTVEEKLRGEVRWRPPEHTSPLSVQ